MMKNLVADSSQSQSNANYNRLLKSSFANFHHHYLNKRLQNMLQDFNGEWFLSTDHKQRFMKSNKPYTTKKVCAVLYLLSADDDLWHRAYGHIHSEEISLADIPLQGISTDGYALYQTARTIATGKEYIHINEIADDQFISNFAFQTIIHAILIAKYGSTILNTRQ